MLNKNGIFLVNGSFDQIIKKFDEKSFVFWGLFFKGETSNKSNLQFNISSQNLRSEPNFRVQERLIQMSHDMPELKRKRF